MKTSLLYVCLMLIVATSVAMQPRDSLQKITHKLSQLHLPTLLEIQTRMSESKEGNKADSFSSMLTSFRTSLVDQQKASETQSTKDTEFCNKKIHELHEEIHKLNHTILHGNHEKMHLAKHVKKLKEHVQKIVLKLDPRVKELKSIVANIEAGAAARAQQKAINHQKLSDTAKMRNIISQLSKDLSAEGQLKFRETLVSLQKEVSDTGLHRFLESSLKMLAPDQTSTNSSITDENVAKLKQLLFLLDSEMRDYGNQIEATEHAAHVAWKQVLGTFQQHRILIQKETAALLHKKTKLIEEIHEKEKKKEEVKESLEGLPEKLSVLVAQFGTWTNQCGVKSQYYSAQTVSRRDQIATIDAVLSLSSSFQNSNVQTVLNKLASQASTTPTSSGSTTPTPVTTSASASS